MSTIFFKKLKKFFSTQFRTIANQSKNTKTDSRQNSNSYSKVRNRTKILGTKSDLENRTLGTKSDFKGLKNFRKVRFRTLELSSYSKYLSTKSYSKTAYFGRDRRPLKRRRFFNLLFLGDVTFIFEVLEFFSG